MPVLVGYQASQPASWFVTVDTFAAPQSGMFHTRERYLQGYLKENVNHLNTIAYQILYICIKLFSDGFTDKKTECNWIPDKPSG